MLPGEGSLYLAGLFLRFGVPLGLTLILAWLLRNLDLHWMEETEGETQAEGSIRMLVPSECWVISKISEDGDSTDVLQEPCWKVRLTWEGRLPDECLDCKNFSEGLLDHAA